MIRQSLSYKPAVENHCIKQPVAIVSDRESFSLC